MKNYSIITDKDFVESYLKYTKLPPDDYHIIYGVLRHSRHKIIKDLLIYNLLACLVKKKQVAILRFAQIKAWRTLIHNVIEKLNTYGEDVLVTVPFCGLFGRDKSEIIQNYQLADDILEEFQNSDCQDIKFISNIPQAYPIPSMNDLFMEYYTAIYRKINLEDKSEEEIEESEATIISDEIIRRDLPSSKDFKPSKYYEEDKYSKMVYEDDRRAALMVEEIDDSEDTSIIADGTTPETVSNIKKIGVVYYMLRDALKNDQDLLVKIANYVTNRNYSKALIANNAAYKYVRSPQHLIDKQYKIDYIKEQLRRYDIAIPDELFDKK